MKQKLTSHRRAAALLFAAAALPFTPGFAQETIAPPPVVVTPPPVVVSPPPPASSAPPPVVSPSPVTTLRATPTEQPATRRAATRATTRTVRTTTAARAPTRAATPAPAAPPPAAVAEPAAPPASAALPAPPPAAPEPIAEAAELPLTEEGGGIPWIWVIAGLALVAGLAAFLLLRRRRTVEEEDYHYDEPTVVAPIAPAIEPQPYIAPYVAPAMARSEEPIERFKAAPIAAGSESVGIDRAEADVRQAIAAETTPAVETLAVGEPAREDVAAMAAASEPQGNRPWLEMLMRPLRAGTTGDDARVEFELTVGNTGSSAARDVRISTWMFPAGAERASEMERLLIDSESSIEPGDGTRVEAAIALPKSGLVDSVLPVVVADARYTLPDGSEGRTQAAFAVGMPQDGELAPFPVDRSSGLLETVEARLHGDLQRA